MDTETLRRRVGEVKYWYHRIELPNGVVTPGWSPLNQAVYRVPTDLIGKRVLDVGAWDGYWTFEALKRGAREVVAIDDFSDYLGSLRPEDRTGWKNFDLCREAFGYTDDRCKRIEISLYEISEEKLGGRFDIVFCFGTLYHLRHPLLGFDKLAEVCNGQIIVESHICDDHGVYRGGLGHGYPPNEIVAEFYPANNMGSNASNWWGPTLKCVAALIYAAGFTQNIQAWKLTDQPRHLSQCRGFATGFKPAETSNQESAKL
jgi:tRNA (mo5U34)-methyltransferase